MKNKILFINSASGYQRFGGVELQMTKYYSFLKKSGHSIKYFNPHTDKIENFDIIFFFSLNPTNYDLIKYAKKCGKKIIIVPSYWNLNEIILKNTELNIIERVGYVVLANIYKKTRFKLFEYINPALFPLPIQEKILNLADHIIVNSKIEKTHICEEFNLKKSKIKVIYNGVDSKYDNDVSPEKFRAKFNINGNYILYVGRIEPKKNIHNLIEAANNLDLNLIIIGEFNNKYKRYADKIKNLLTDNIKLVGFIPPDSELIKSAYNGAQTFALVGYAETPGIAALEAGLSKCNIVITNRGSTTEYFRKDGIYVDPTSLNSIKHGLKYATTLTENNKLKEKIKKKFIWRKTLLNLKDLL